MLPTGILSNLSMEFECSDVNIWREALLSYESAIRNLGKPKLIPLDDFYRNELPDLLRQRHPDPYITSAELSTLMEWKLSRGKWRPRLLSFVSSLDDAVVRDASRKAFAALPDVPTAVSHLTTLKGVGPATASAVLAAYAPDVAPFMSDEVSSYSRVFAIEFAIYSLIGIEDNGNLNDFINFEYIYIIEFVIISGCNISYFCYYVEN